MKVVEYFIYLSIILRIARKLITNIDIVNQLLKHNTQILPLTGKGYKIM